MKSLKTSVLVSASLITLAASPQAYSQEALTCADLEFGTLGGLGTASKAVKLVSSHDEVSLRQMHSEVLALRCDEEVSLPMQQGSEAGQLWWQIYFR